jgi:hypothetical protein
MNDLGVGGADEVGGVIVVDAPRGVRCGGGGVSIMGVLDGWKLDPTFRLLILIFLY